MQFLSTIISSGVTVFNFGKRRPPMTRAPVHSTDIASIGYDEQSRTLEVEFVRGKRVFVYRAVEPDMYRRLREATSIGAFFREHVRDNYDNEEIKNERTD